MNNIEQMLEAVSKKLGTTPEKLQKSLEKGDLKQAMANMSEKDVQKLSLMLNNKKLMEQLMQSKQAQEVIKNLKEKK